MIFKYKAYERLLLELGRLDYVVEISEIAVKDFLNKLDNSENPENFLKSKCEEYGIMVSFDNENKYYNQIVLGNISNVYHLAETFIYELQTEYNKLTCPSDNWVFVEGKTKLDQVLSFFKNRVNNTDKVDEYLVDTFVYYHQLRVYFSHKKTTSIAEITRKYNDAVKHYDEELLKRYKIKSPPKNISDLDFEDYFLFTQISKDLALKLCSIGYPEPEGFSKSDEFKCLRKLKDNNDRFITAIENVLKTEFGFIKENDSDNLVETIAVYL